MRDTLRFFGLSEPAYRYALSQAIEEGHLAPYRIYRAMTVKTAAEGGFEVRRAELGWSAMDDKAREEFEALFADSDTITVDPNALERKFTIPERNRALAREFRDVLEKGFMGGDGARLVIDEPTVLTQVVSQLNDLRLDQVDADTKGDLFEHMLRQIRQAGEIGQFRTPRHVIRALARLVDPRLGETIYDPAAGTDGFLAAAWDHIRLANSSPDGIEAIDAEGKAVQRGLGDTLSRDAVKQLREATFYGADVDPQMVRLATMNLTLRGLDQVCILRRDALTRPLDRAAKAELGFPARGFDVILANPPFSGRLDKDRIVEDVRIGRTAQTELLFLQYMLNHLREGGRCGVVVPEGVLFGSTGAHKELKRKLIGSNTVEAVLSLPGGVFNPYAGVKTSALVFRKGGATGRVMFLHADNDGFKLDANHDQPIDEDDLPGLIEAFRDREARWRAWKERDAKADWTEKWWFADADAIRAADLNLSANRHRPQRRAKVEHRDPLEILEELRAIETEMLGEIDMLTEAVSGAGS